MPQACPRAVLGAVRLRAARPTRSYPHAAYFAVRESQALDGAEIWRAFLAKLDGTKPNPRLNPLFHSPPGCTCARCSFTDGSGISSISSRSHARHWPRVTCGRHSTAWIGSAGIGPKITPFFLRDAATWFEIAPTRNRELLQPVDMWARRYVTRIAGDAVRGTDSQVANWICANSTAPEAFNQGLWYLGSQIAASDVKLHRALDDDEYARDLVEHYVSPLHDAVTAWRPASHDKRGD